MDLNLGRMTWIKFRWFWHESHDMCKETLGEKPINIMMKKTQEVHRKINTRVALYCPPPLSVWTCNDIWCPVLVSNSFTRCSCTLECFQPFHVSLLVLFSPLIYHLCTLSIDNNIQLLLRKSFKIYFCQNLKLSRPPGGAAGWSSFRFCQKYS